MCSLKMVILDVSDVMLVWLFVPGQPNALLIFTKKVNSTKPLLEVKHGAVKADDSDTNLSDIFKT